MPHVARLRLPTGLLAVLLGAFTSWPATAQRAAPVTAPDFLGESPETAPPAPRLAEALHLPPLAALRTAEDGARDSLEALEAWNAAGRLPTRTGFTRPLPGAPRVRLSLAEVPAGGEIRLHPLPQRTSASSCRSSWRAASIRPRTPPSSASASSTGPAFRQAA